MAPLIAMAIKMLLPVAVSEVQKKLAEEPNNGHSSDPKEVPLAAAAPLAAKLATIGTVKSKTAWIALAIAAAGFFEQNQQLVTGIIGEGYSGYVIAAIGGIMFFLRTISVGSIVDKGEPKE